MNARVITLCHDLAIVTVGMIRRFGRSWPAAMADLVDDRAGICEVPGTVTVSSTCENGIYSTEIGFRVSPAGPEEVSRLESLRHSRLLAFYTDETGARRVCGSPDWPLHLDYRTEGGTCACTLTGSDTAPDCWLR